MRAVRLTEKTPLDELTLSEVDTPSPQRGEALIRLKAAALNHRDLRFFDAPVDQPVILGSDGAGVIEALGEGVTSLTVGDEVIINPSLHWGDREDAADQQRWSILGGPVDGTFAEYITIPTSHIHPKPAHLSMEEAAAVPLAGLTAYRALTSRGRLKSGERVLVHGIGGGVAIFALQFARALGAKVMVTSTQDWKLERAAALGAAAGANAKTEDWVQKAREWTGGTGVDLVIDSLGGEYVNKSLDAMRDGGRFVSYGRTLSGDATISIRNVFWRHQDILGTTMGSPRDFAAMLALLTRERITPVVDIIFPLREAREAFRHMQGAKQLGKIVLAM